MRRLFLAAPVLAAFVAGAAAAPIAPARADSYNDTTTGIYVATPDDFRISRGVREGYALALHIDPTGSYPNRVEGESLVVRPLLQGGAVQRDAAMVQCALEERGVAGGCARLLERVMEIKSEETFTLRDEKGGDVVGLEVVGPVARNPSAVLMTSLFNTPRGQLQMSCLLRSDQAAKAGFALRAIRDTIKLPK